MKKIITLVVSIVLVCVIVFTLSACNNNLDLGNDTVNTNTYSLYVPDGATTMAVASLLANNMVGMDDVNVTVSNAQGVQAKVLNGEADMAILPTNLCANLYNKGIEYQLVTVNVQGLLYLVGRENVGVEQLVGKLVYSIGKSNTPEYVFKKILDEKNIPYVEGDIAQAGKVTIKYVGSGSEILPLLIGKHIDYAILGEPAVSTALSKDSTLKTILDLQKEWGNVTGLSSGYPQAGLFVKKSIIKDNAKFVADLIDVLKTNNKYLQENLDSLQQLFEKAGSTELKTVNFTADLITRCNLNVTVAGDAYNSLVKYFETLNSQSIGGKLPDNGFYYGYGE